MLSTIEKRRIKKLIYSKVTLVIVTVLLIFVARGTWDVYKKAEYAQTNEERAKQELQKLKEREDFLVNELRNLESVRGQEAELRSRFDVGREGEKLVVLVDAPEPIVHQEPAQDNFLTKIKNFFGFGE